MALIDTYRHNVTRKRDEIAKLTSDKAKEKDKIAKAIGDEAALVFASQFYSSIGFGKNIKTAFDQAKAALMLEGIPEETTPELYVRDSLKAEDIVLVKP